MLPCDLALCGKAANGSIDKAQKRALMKLLDDHESTFDVLLAKKNKIIIHFQNLRVFMIEIYKRFHCINLFSILEYFTRKDTKYDIGI